MYKKNTFKKLILNALLCICAMFQMQGQVLNGSFEAAPALPLAGSWLIMPPNTVNNWTVAVGPVDLHDSGHISMGGHLRRHIDLNLTGDIWQNVGGLIPGTQYIVSFITRIHANMNLVGHNANAQVSIGASGGGGPYILMQPWNLSFVGGGLNWRRLAFCFTPTDTIHRLRFTGMGSTYTAGGILIDDVSVSLPCNEGIRKDTLSCTRYRFTLTDYTTVLQNAYWTVDGVRVHNGFSFVSTLTVGPHIICADYFGIQRACDTNIICCKRVCTTVNILPFDSTKCLTSRTVNCGTNYDVDTSWRRSCSCNGVFSDSTGWFKVSDGTSVNHLFMDIRDDIIIRKIYYDSIHCKSCTITVNILVAKSTITGGAPINCPCQTFNLAQFKAYLISLNSACNTEISNATSFVIRKLSDNSLFTLTSANNYSLCPGEQYEIGNITNNVSGCCVFKLTAFCNYSPGSQGQDDLPRFTGWEHFDYLFSELYKNNNLPILNENNIPTHSLGKNIEAKSDLIVVPNQSKGVFRIQQKKGNSQTFDKVEIISSVGEVVFIGEKINSNQKIDISDKSSGIYFIKVTRGTIVSTLQMVKE